MRNVGVRSRGLGSRSDRKLGLQIDFNFYTTGQRFLGLKSIVLDNLWQDRALIREFMAMAVYRRMGEAAPRESFAKLYINNVYQGLYAIVEEIDGDFAERETGESGGYLFDYHWTFAFYGDDLGPNLETYKPMFEPRTHELETDDELYGPLRDLFDNANEPDDALWLDLIGQRLDLPQFMKCHGIEAFVAEGDGLLGYVGMNNFYLFRSPGTTRHRIISLGPGPVVPVRFLVGRTGVRGIQPVPAGIREPRTARRLFRRDPGRGADCNRGELARVGNRSAGRADR